MKSSVERSFVTFVSTIFLDVCLNRKENSLQLNLKNQTRSSCLRLCVTNGTNKICCFLQYVDFTPVPLVLSTYREDDK